MDELIDTKNIWFHNMYSVCVQFVDKVKEKIQKVYDSRLDVLKMPRCKRHSEMFAKKTEAVFFLYVRPFGRC